MTENVTYKVRFIQLSSLSALGDTVASPRKFLLVIQIHFRCLAIFNFLLISTTPDGPLYRLSHDISSYF